MKTNDAEKIRMAYLAITDTATLQHLLQELTRCIESSTDHYWLSMSHAYRSILHERMILMATTYAQKLDHDVKSIEDYLLSRFYDGWEQDEQKVTDEKKAEVPLPLKKITASQKKQLALKIAHGEAAYQAKNYEEAILAFDEAIAIHPKCVPALKGRSFAGLESGQYQRITQDCERIKEINATLATLILGHFHLRNAQLHEASVCFDSIMKRLDLEERIAIGQACIDMGAFDLAYFYCDFNKAEELAHPKTIDLFIDIGDHALRHRDWVLAKNSYTKLIGYEHSYTFKALFNVAQIEANHGSYVRAKFYLSQVEGHPEFALQENWVKAIIEFGLLLCSMKLNQQQQLPHRVEQLLRVYPHPLWEKTIAQLITYGSPKQTTSQGTEIYIVGALPTELLSIMQPFLRANAFSQNLISLFFNVSADHIKTFARIIDWEQMYPEQLNEVYHGEDQSTVTPLIALLSNPNGYLLLFLCEHIRNLITEESLNTVYLCDVPRSALLTLMAHPSGPKILRQYPKLCDKITVEGLNGEDFDLTKSPSPLLLCVNSLDGQRLLENNPGLRGKITRAGLLAAMHFAKTHQCELAFKWLACEIKRPEYQSLLLHHQLLFTKPAILPQHNEQSLVIYSKATSGHFWKHGIHETSPKSAATYKIGN